MKHLALMFALTCLVTDTLSAQDLTGRWTGVADTTDEAGTKRMERQTLEIKMVDGKIAGLRVNRAGTGGSAVAVQQVGPKVNLYELLPLDGGEHLRWKFELKDGKLVGTFAALHDNPTKWQYDRIGAMTLTKVEAKPEDAPLVAAPPAAISPAPASPAAPAK